MLARFSYANAFLRGRISLDRRDKIAFPFKKVIVCSPDEASASR